LFTCYYTLELHFVNSPEVVRLLSDIFVYLLIVTTFEAEKTVWTSINIIN